VIFLVFTVDILHTLVCLLLAALRGVIISISLSLLTLVGANTPGVSFTTPFSILLSLSLSMAANSSAVRCFHLMALDHHFLRSLSRSGRALETVLRLMKGISSGQPMIITE
jgi:uncharacterized membrane protein